MSESDQHRAQRIDIQVDGDPDTPDTREAVPADEVLYGQDPSDQVTEPATPAPDEAEPADSDESAMEEDVPVRNFMDEMREGNGEYDDEYVDMPSYDELVTENAKLSRQLANVIRQYDALKSDWESYRKRSQAELERNKKLASERVARQIIPVIDDLWRSIDHIRGMGDELSPLASGNEAIANRIVMALSREGIEVISPLGEPFDVNRHQAIAMQPVEGEEPGMVFHVYQDGYAIGDRVIRPASVGVTQ